ncbi:putative cyclin-D7-1 [Lycium barbarum]|uniref:putative cyclin-D7-1 n=1 Tax=Lycium barbarum TaxID=112863 RepID=UPI00293F1571|nr:putative cyclin-D7-1 [Lycium barbarum]
MKSLLCDEVWLMSPTGDDHMHSNNEINNDVGNSRFSNSIKVECEQAFGILLDKEMSYMPKEGYVKRIKENCFIENARFKAIHWLIKSQRRWNLSFGTVFGAASYLDRFISLNKCQGWRYWMFELLSIACLSVASKFHETSPPQLLKLQMDGIEHLFESTMIQHMELTLLEALGWKLNSTTPYSYVELLQWSINSLKLSVLQDFTSRVNELLLGILLDAKFLEFRPSVIAQSAVNCISEYMSPLIDDSCFNHFTGLIPQDQKDDLSKCQKMMNKQFLIEEFQEFVTCGGYYYGPSSPVTVLTMDDLCDFQLHQYCSVFNIPQGDINFISNVNKHKRNKQEDTDV